MNGVIEKKRLLEQTRRVETSAGREEKPRRVGATRPRDQVAHESSSMRACQKQLFDFGGVQEGARQHRFSSMYAKFITIELLK